MLINNNKISAEKIIFYITFLIFLIIGIRSFQDYGISLDEKWHRETGLLFYNFIKGLFFQADHLEKIDAYAIKEIVLNIDKSPATHPVVFDLPIEFLIDIFNIKNSYQIF